MEGYTMGFLLPFLVGLGAFFFGLLAGSEIEIAQWAKAVCEERGQRHVEVNGEEVCMDDATKTVSYMFPKRAEAEKARAVRE